MFLIYQLLLSLALVFSPIIIIYRLFKNKEHGTRFIEKFSFNNKKRINGKLIWFHGASVGEILSIIPIVKYYEKHKKIKQILVTSSTLSSAKVFENEQVLVFMDIMPRSSGHLLVIPKSKARNILDINTDQLHAVIDTVQLWLN